MKREKQNANNFKQTSEANKERGMHFVAEIENTANVICHCCAIKYLLHFIIKSSSVVYFSESFTSSILHKINIPFIPFAFVYLLFV